MMGRTTDLVFTLVADDFIMMCHPCQMGMTSKAGDTACSPITECDAGAAPDPNKHIFNTKDALLTRGDGTYHATCPHQCRQGDGKWEWDSAHEKCSTCRRFTSKSACEVHLCNMKGDGCCA